LARFAKGTEDYEATKLEIGKYQKNPKFWGFTFASVESGKFFLASVESGKFFPEKFYVPLDVVLLRFINPNPIIKAVLELC
jgi:hypothetical protein